MTTGDRPRLLLHTCCAVCSTVALERLSLEHHVTLFYYNPNIHPEAEYRKRLEATQAFAHDQGFVVIEGPYEPEVFAETIRGLEHLGERSDRCRACFAFRLLATAERARAEGHEVFATTLTTSRHKRSADVHAAGRAAAEATGVSYLETDLKKQAGADRCHHLARQHGLYQQNYCGCVHSMRERDARVRRAREAVR